MSVIKIELLKNANTTTPSDPVLIAGLIGGPNGTRVGARQASNDYAASGNIDVVFEKAENEGGPWRDANIAYGVTNDQAGVLDWFDIGGIRETIWLRARLSAAPSVGSLSITLYGFV